MWASLTLEALVSISSHRMRTFLAMLGIVIGVSSVVALVAIGTGSSRQVEGAIKKLGTNMLIVTPGARDSKGITSNEFSQLTRKDADAIGDMYGVVAAAAVSGRDRKQVAAGKNNWKTIISGTTAEFFIIRDWDFEDGGPFSDEDVRVSARVAVVGQTIANQLFDRQNPVGRTLRIGGLPFRIIGLLEEKGQSLTGRDQDDVIYLPITTHQRKIDGSIFQESVDMIMVKGEKLEWLDPISEDLIRMLRERHKVRPAVSDPFSVRSLTSMTAATSETTKALSYLLGAIASISLIVGGIGIMNIMLVTVTERTREIGIRKAIGATNSQVMWQFLLEAVVISAAGSVIGLALGVGAAKVAETYMGIPAALTLWSVVIAVTVAIMVGVLSGLYPARKASKLQPIDALRQVGG